MFYSMASRVPGACPFAARLDGMTITEERRPVPPPCRDDQPPRPWPHADLVSPAAWRTSALAAPFHWGA
jgi:hypothetical protein